MRPGDALRDRRAPRIHPWTEAKDLAQAARIVERAGKANGGILVDAFHLSRSRSRVDDIARLPASRFRYAQLCDVPAAIPPTMDAIVAEARAERRFPGEGELDLVALVRALPRGIPLSLEVPTLQLAKSVAALDRARRALAGARRVLAQAEGGEATQSSGALATQR
jgi:sugar phosphate isomerase/epimerase